MEDKIKKIGSFFKRDKLWLLIILVILAILFKINKIEISFGIEIDLSGVFLLLILLSFGMKKALITTTIISVGYIMLLNGEFIQIIDILKIGIIGMIYRSKWKMNIIISEFIFWGIFTIPIIYSVVLLGDGGRLESYYYFNVLFLIVNGVLNSFIAEINFIYLINTKIYNKKIRLKYKETIIHIVTLAILIPFIINIFTNLRNSYDNIWSTAELSSDEIYDYILDELEGWTDRNITNLKLSAVIEVGLLKESISKSMRYKPYNIHIRDRNNKMMVDIGNYKKEMKIYDEYKIYDITEKLYRKLPISKEKRYLNDNWSEGYFVYDKKLGEFGLSVMIEIPIELYNDRIISEYLRQFKFLLLFTFFMAIISGLLNRTIFNSLSELSIVTNDLPEKLQKDISIKWPDSNIVEISSLTNNIENMADTIRENFINLNETKKKLYELAYYDSLTTLPNRVLFKKHLEEIVESNGFKSKICVMFIDLNRFKVVNDTWGHDIGDKLLSEVANRLKNIQNEKCNIFRLGGDEFVVVVNVNDNNDIKNIGEIIISKFIDGFKINDLDISTSCSIGASVYPDDSTDIDVIIKYADIAMYASKENGGNFLQTFNKEINDKVIKKIAIEEGIKETLDNNGFVLHYQPKFSGRDGRITSMEALIRWQSDSLGFVPPDKFIPIAEETDLILKIDRWVILNACIQNKRLHDEGYNKIPVSVNISARHFAYLEFLDMVEDVLEKSELSAKYLKIEITEGVLIKNTDMVKHIIRKLKELGVQVSIDDFGKGYSSLNQLMTLPIDEVKIDREFITNINEDIKKKNVVRLIVELAHSLNLNVVAEGIEQEEEKLYLQSIECDELQGYLFSKPINIEELKSFLIRGRDNNES